MSTDGPIQDWSYWYNRSLHESVENIELKRENKRLRDALKWYANPQTYEIGYRGDGKFEDVLELPPDINDDKGRKARQALESATDEN